MSAPDSAHVTSLLKTASGDSESARELIQILYEELRRVAARMIAEERPDHTLQATALVNELYLKLVDQTRVGASDRAHFLAIAARVMRQILVNHALAKKAQKRGGDRDRRVLDSQVGVASRPSVDVLHLEDALRELAKEKSRVADVVTLRYFGGLSVPEVAEVLDVSERTVALDWRFARAWLSHEMSRESARRDDE